MTINCKGNLIDLSQPKVMGILNSTPDSFYEGSRISSQKNLLQTVEKMLNDGATFLDVGGYSSRPGADDISIDKELERVLPVITTILKEFPEALISVDTFRSQVAKKSIEAGAALINDISAGQLDDGMLNMVGSLNVPYIMMHMRGTPKTMQKKTHYDDLLKDIIYFFSERIRLAVEHKIKDIIVDPGFGFSKTTAQNFNLLNKLNLLKILDKPILSGVSRKSMIYKTLGTEANKALNGTTALNMIALERGATILRAHDVKEAVECVTLYKAVKA
jgi:dihydropteroate synthase